MNHDLQDLAADARVTWTDDVLRYGDTDANGHINNAVFATLCESGRVDLFGRHLVPHLPATCFFVVVRLAIDFKLELHYPGAVRTGTWLCALGRTSMTLRQGLFSDGRLAAASEAVCVLMDGATRRPIAPPEPMRAVMEGLVREDA